MPKVKIYKCCICHKVLTKEKPIRLAKKIYGAGRYNEYYPVEHYDICKKCYGAFDRWIKKHEEEGDSSE